MCLNIVHRVILDGRLHMWHYALSEGFWNSPLPKHLKSKIQLDLHCRTFTFFEELFSVSCIRRILKSIQPFFLRIFQETRRRQLSKLVYYQMEASTLATNGEKLCMKTGM